VADPAEAPAVMDADEPLDALADRIVKPAQRDPTHAAEPAPVVLQVRIADARLP
jgi:hypothetical protein